MQPFRVHDHQILLQGLAIHGILARGSQFLCYDHGREAVENLAIHGVLAF